MGPPIGSVEFMKHEIHAKLDECNSSLGRIADIS